MASFQVGETWPQPRKTSKDVKFSWDFRGKGGATHFGTSSGRSIDKGQQILSELLGK
jgi:hypothetical protein